MTDGAGDDVTHHRGRESEQHEAANGHEAFFEAVERAPFEMAVPLQDQVRHAAGAEMLADGEQYVGAARYVKGLR